MFGMGVSLLGGFRQGLLEALNISTEPSSFGFSPNVIIPTCGQFVKWALQVKKFSEG